MYASAVQSKYGNHEWLIETVSGLSGVKRCIQERQGMDLEKVDKEVAKEYGWEVSLPFDLVYVSFCSHTLHIY